MGIHWLFSNIHTILADLTINWISSHYKFFFLPPLAPGSSRTMRHFPIQFNKNMSNTYTHHLRAPRMVTEYLGINCTPNPNMLGPKKSVDPFLHD